MKLISYIFALLILNVSCADAKEKMSESVFLANLVSKAENATGLTIDFSPKRYDAPTSTTQYVDNNTTLSIHYHCIRSSVCPKYGS